MKKINIVIVEDDEQIQEGLSFFLNKTKQYKCIASFSTGEEAIEQIPALQPDIVLMDIGLPGIDGIECLKEVKKILPGVLVVMLTVFSDDERIFRSILAGADGYILKKDPMEQILESLGELRTNGAPMNAQIAKRILEIFRGVPIRNTSFNLSDREKEILDMLVKGFNYKQIAVKIFLSPETVRWHLKNIYEKLQVHSKTEAVVKYMQAEKFHLT